MSPWPPRTVPQLVDAIVGSTEEDGQLPAHLMALERALLSLLRHRATENGLKTLRPDGFAKLTEVLSCAVMRRSVELAGAGCATLGNATGGPPAEALEAVRQVVAKSLSKGCPRLELCDSGGHDYWIRATSKHSMDGVSICTDASTEHAGSSIADGDEVLGDRSQNDEVLEDLSNIGATLASMTGLPPHVPSPQKDKVIIAQAPVGLSKWSDLLGDNRCFGNGRSNAPMAEDEFKLARSDAWVATDTSRGAHFNIPLADEGAALPEPPNKATPAITVDPWGGCARWSSALPSLGEEPVSSVADVVVLPPALVASPPILCRQSSAPLGAYKGRLLSYDPVKRYGFIACDAVPVDLFVHANAIVGPLPVKYGRSSVPAGPEMQFDIDMKADRPRAINACLIGDNELPAPPENEEHIHSGISGSDSSWKDCEDSYPTADDIGRVLLDDAPVGGVAVRVCASTEQPNNSTVHKDQMLGDRTRIDEVIEDLPNIGPTPTGTTSLLPLVPSPQKDNVLIAKAPVGSSKWADLLGDNRRIGNGRSNAPMAKEELGAARSDALVAEDRSRDDRSNVLVASGGAAPAEPCNKATPLGTIGPSGGCTRWSSAFPLSTVADAAIQPSALAASPPILCNRSSPALGAYKGRLLSYDPVKGYGFIACDAVPADVFLPANSIVGAQPGKHFRSLATPGPEIQFDINMKASRPRAINAVLIGDSGLPAPSDIGKEKNIHAGISDSDRTRKGWEYSPPTVDDILAILPDDAPTGVRDYLIEVASSRAWAAQANKLGAAGG